VLRDILKVEDEIRKIQHNSIYRKLRTQIRFLTSQSNRGFITVLSPENLETQIKVRKDSIEMREVLSDYQERYEKFSKRLVELQIKKRDLKSKIFV
jgi:hypothetical protein